MTCMFRDCFAVAQNGFRGAPNCFMGPRGDVHSHTRARGKGALPARQRWCTLVRWSRAEAESTSRGAPAR